MIFMQTIWMCCKIHSLQLWLHGKIMSRAFPRKEGLGVGRGRYVGLTKSTKLGEEHKHKLSCTSKEKKLNIVQSRCFT